MIQAMVEEELETSVRFLWGHLASVTMENTEDGNLIWTAKGHLTNYYLDVELITEDEQKTPLHFAIRLFYGDPDRDPIRSWETPDCSREELVRKLNMASDTIIKFTEEEKNE